MDERRVRMLKEGGQVKGPVIYWMDRDQRDEDNWALSYAQKLALEMRMPLCVVFCLEPYFPPTIRQYDFMLKGLRELEQKLREKNIYFHLPEGLPEDEIPSFIKDIDAGILVTDFSPLNFKRAWKQKVADRIAIPFYEVDTHNIVPCWVASAKQEYAAYTFRPKIRRLIPEFLTEMPKLKSHPYRLEMNNKEPDWGELTERQKTDRTVSVVNSFRAGMKSAFQMLSVFIGEKLMYYDKSRNDPTINCLSNLSPYLHFGQISPQRVALKVLKCNANEEAKHAFLEELIIRRELSDNFCFYNHDYDNFNGFPEWSKKTLNIHREDHRDYIYSLKEFEKALTHDELWNVAQTEMVKNGKMHGYMRMYWAKKILEWSPTPEQSMEAAIHLNDQYSLDGSDPNGYTGIAWSIGGVHDRAWNERVVFGKIRYMSYRGRKSKFNIKKYIEKNICPK